MGEGWGQLGQNGAITGKASDSGMESRPVASNPYNLYFSSMVLGLKIPIIFIAPPPNNSLHPCLKASERFSFLSNSLQTDPQLTMALHNPARNRRPNSVLK